MWSQICYKTGMSLAILRSNVLNIQLFKNMTLHSKSSPPTPCHTLSQKSKDPPPPLCDVICEWPLSTKKRSSQKSSTELSSLFEQLRSSTFFLTNHFLIKNCISIIKKQALRKATTANMEIERSKQTHEITSLVIT